MLEIISEKNPKGLEMGKVKKLEITLEESEWEGRSGFVINLIAVMYPSLCHEASP